MLSKKPPHQFHYWLTDIFSLAVICLIFYTLFLGHYPLFTPDEGRYSEVAREMVATGDYITPRVNGVAFLDKPILYYWLQAAAINLFGVTEWALRLFPALLGVMGCLMTYICGRRMFDRRTGILSAIILATTPLYFGGAHYANLDLEVAVLISCTLLSIITAFQCEGKSRHYFLFAGYIFAALAFLTKGLIGLAFPGIITLTWMTLTQRWNLLKQIHLISGLTLFFCIVLPWYYLVQQANPEFLHFFFVTQQVTRFLSGAVFNNATPYWFYIPIVLAGFFPWTIFLFQALYKTIRAIISNNHTHQAELFLLIWFGFIFTFFSIPHSKTIGYILPIFPALALLTGRYIASVWENTQTNSTQINVGLFALFSLIFAGFLLALPYIQLIDFASDFTIYLRTIATTFLIGIIVAIYYRKKKTIFSLVTICATCSIIYLLTLTLGASHLNQSSTKPLVSELKKIIKPQDEVASYFKFFQDVPIYLEQRITLVANWNAPDIALKDNWVRELWYGMAFQKTDDWLINEEIFWQRWESNKRIFVFVNANYFDQFKQHAKNYYFIGKHNNIMLLSNQPTILSLAKDPQFT